MSYLHPEVSAALTAFKTEVDRIPHVSWKEDAEYHNKAKQEYERFKYDAQQGALIYDTYNSINHVFSQIKRATCEYKRVNDKADRISKYIYAACPEIKRRHEAKT